MARGPCLTLELLIISDMECLGELIPAALVSAHRQLVSLILWVVLIIFTVTIYLLWKSIF